MPKLEFRELSQTESFDPLALTSAASFTQSDFYRAWQESVGRSVRRFVWNENGKPAAYAQVVKFSLPFGQSYLYIPYGPVAYAWTPELLEHVSRDLKTIVHKENAVFCRLDLSPPITKDRPLYYRGRSLVSAPGWTYQASAFQPRQKWELDITRSEQELLAGMHHKTRYNIRLAEKKGVKIKTVESDFLPYIERFYTALMETAGRDEFGTHPKKYYEAIFRRAEQEKNTALFIAEHEGTTLGMLFVIFHGSRGIYLLGTSSNEKRDLKAPHLLHWTAIKHAKSRGAHFYNFGGVDTTGKLWKGVTDFKTSWGGSVVQYGNFFDIVTKPLWYFAYCVQKFLKK